MKPLVSILIPAYNAKTCIGATLKSALAQSWPNKEIIVVDDGSKDETFAVANRFAGNGLTVVTQKNQGAAAARNKAFELSRGDYIQWLDADDLLSVDKITAQMEAVRNGSGRTLLSSGWGYFRYRQAKAKFVPTLLWKNLQPVEWLLRKWENNLHMQTATWLVSRELTEAAGPWDTTLLGDDDGEYFFRVVRASNEIRFVNNAQVFYRISGSNSLSHIGRSKEKMAAQFHGMKLQIGYLLSIQDDARTRAACVNYLQTWFIHFYPDQTEIVKGAQELAESLGGRLQPPRLSWKYAWIQKALGWSVAKDTQLFYNHMKSSLLRAWDGTLFHLENK